MLLNKTKTAMRVLREKGLGSVVNLLKHNLGLSKHIDESGVIYDYFKSLGFTGTLIDVGAHLGYGLKPFASDGWKVFAFEPDPDNREQLMKLASNFSSVNLDTRALSDVPAKQVSFYKSNESDGVSGLQAFLPSHKSQYLVDVTTLADVIAEKSITAIDFLKIDTEGFDLLVLKGMNWEKIQPRLILCEFEDSKTLPLGYSYHDMAHYIVEQGYKVIVSEWKPIKRYGEKHAWRGFYTYPHQLKVDRAWGNLIACRDDEDFQALSTFLKV